VVAKTKDHIGTNQCKLAIYSDAGFATNVFLSSSAVEATSNNNWVAKMTASTGLVANATYYYRIEVDGVEDDAKTGRFKAAPAQGGGNFKIAFGNSNNRLNSQVYGWMKQYDPLFFIDTGDFHYLDINDADEAVALARHQAAYENNLNVNGTAPLQAEFYRNVAFGYMWDDHDFGPNDAHAKGSSASHLTTPEAQSAVHTAFRQYAPHWPINLESNTNFPAGKAPIAQAFTIGRVRFILSDIRSQSEQNGSTATNATLMGAEQKEWFKEELLKANGTYPLIVWLTSTPWNGAQASVTGNKWYQHTGERAEISNFLEENHIRGFSAIGGDAHMAAIDDGSNTDFSTGGGAGFPIIHAAPIGNKNSYKGGPYSEGASAAADYQYGSMEFEDRTNELVSSWFCLNGPSSVTNIITATEDNIGNPLKYIFTNSFPVITSLSPVDDATGVEINSDLILTFNEPIQEGTGSISIYTLTNNALVEAIAVTSAAVTVTGNQMTINPTSDLQKLTAYYVTMDEGVVTDGTHDFPGIYAPAGVDYKKWNFFSEGLEILVDQSNISVPEGGTNTFMVRLSEDPLAMRTVSINWVSGDTHITVSGGASLIFDSSTWSSNQTVTLSAAQDPDFANGPALIRCSSPGLFNINITATESDDDPVLHIETSTNRVFVPEGNTNTFQVRLDAQPNTTVTVQVGRASGDSNITVSDGETLLFDAGNHSVWKTITLSAAEDNDYSEDPALIDCTSTYLSTTTVTAIEQENDLGQTLPFEETFEPIFPMAGTIGAIDGQHGWTGSGTVQTNIAYADSQACLLEGGTLEHLFDGAPAQIDVGFYAQATPGDATPASVPAEATVVFYVNTNHQIVAYSNQTAVELSTSILSNDWNFFEVSGDYTNDTWSLSVNGTNAVQNFPFYNASTGFVGISFFEGSGTTSYFDNVSISTGGDSDSDGLPDEWEIQYYGGLSPNPGDACSNGVNTVWEAYIAGLNPTNPTSFLFLSTANPLQWTVVDGRVYTVWWTSNLLSGFNEILVSNYTSGAFTDLLHNTDNEGFYKLDVKLSNP